MGYYKIITGDQVVDVVEDPVWITVGHNGIPIRCQAAEARGVVSNDGTMIYQIEGTVELDDQYEVVRVADISEDEYVELSTILDLHGTPSVDRDEIQWEPVESVDIPDLRLEDVKTRKHDLMKEKCLRAFFDEISNSICTAENEQAALDMIRSQLMSQCLRLGCITKWIDSCESIAEIGGIDYSADIPEQFGWSKTSC